LIFKKFPNYSKQITIGIQINHKNIQIDDDEIINEENKGIKNTEDN